MLFQTCMSFLLIFFFEDILENVLIAFVYVIKVNGSIISYHFFFF